MEKLERRQDELRNVPEDAPDDLPAARPSGQQGLPVLERPVYEDFASGAGGAPETHGAARAAVSLHKGVVLKRAIPKIRAQGGAELAQDLIKSGTASAVSAPDENKGAAVRRDIPEIPAQGGERLARNPDKGDAAPADAAPDENAGEIRKLPAPSVMERAAFPATKVATVPATEAAAVPATGAAAVPAAEAAAVPTAEATAVPAVKAAAVPVAEATAVPAVKAAAVPAVDALTIPEESGAGRPAESERAALAKPVSAPPSGPEPLSNDAVTGHTAALWKYRPVPEDEPEPAPEYRKMHQRYPGGEVIAARVRGKKHKHEGTNCDDWYEASACGELVFAAVSDGAGSKRFSRIGARESCRAAVGCLRRGFGDLLAGKPELLRNAALPFSDPRCVAACGDFAAVVQRAVLKAREAVEAAWYTRLADPAYEAVLGRMPALTDFAATLLVSAVIPAGGAGHLVVSCQVGDGMSVLLDSRERFENAVKLMGEADSGEFSGETDFLTSPKMASLEALQNRTKLSLSRSDTLLMMTDGVADDYFPPRREACRLYFDLLANGALRGRLSAPTPEVMRCYQSLPPPAAYPWVNDQSVQVPLHYARRALEAGAAMEDLWANRMAFAMTGLASGETDPAENLQRWLDNYVERGSFDDRTLLAILM